MECKQQQNAQNCPCTYDCEKKGHCCDCLSYHLGRKELPACCFSKEAEKTYDRSFQKFIQENS
jgi:uncharacterized protein DUF6485